jgi:hypothetical protein
MRQVIGDLQVDCPFVLGGVLAGIEQHDSIFRFA